MEPQRGKPCVIHTGKTRRDYSVSWTKPRSSRLQDMLKLRMCFRNLQISSFRQIHPYVYGRLEACVAGKFTERKVGLARERSCSSVFRECAPLGDVDRAR